MGKEIIDTNFVDVEPSFDERNTWKGLDFEHWCRANNISISARNLIERIRNSQPSRRVSSGKGSVSGRFPSRKMGMTIQFESHKNELPFIYELEHNSNVLEYYDQPESIKLSYFNKNRNLGVTHTPDFFVIYQDSAGWVECKTENDLLKLAIKSQNRYQLDENNEWSCPPGIEYAKPFGLIYELRSSKKINWIYQKNIEYLEEFFRLERLNLPHNVFHIINDAVREQPAISLETLLQTTSTSVTVNDIFSLIAFEELYVDLKANALTEPDKVKIFINKETAEAYSNIFSSTFSKTQKEKAFRPTLIEMKPNAEIIWDGRGWRILNVGEFNITLLEENGETIQIQQKVFEEFVRKGSISANNPPNDDNKSDLAISKIISQSSSESLRIANYRANIVRAGLDGELPEQVSPRTFRSWRLDHRNAEIQFGFGMGYLGLLPKHLPGNTASKIPETTIRLIEEFIDRDFESITQRNRRSVFWLFEAECQTRGLYPASYVTFCKYVKKRDMHEQTLKRKGKRAAYQHEKFYWELEITTPRHGERPFHIAHIDHTELDIELVDSKTGRNLGRPWMTLLVDAFSRRILSVYLTFDPPSYRSNLMVMRECVHRHGRLPQILVVDGGKEFSSIYFESLLAMFEITKKTRPPAQARFGSVVERLFGTANTMFINNLQGNTQMTKNVRQMTKSVNPKNHAIWTLGTLYENLCEFLYEIYDQKEHSTLNQSPQETFAQGILKSGSRTHMIVPYNEEFKLMTLPSTKKGTVMIDYSRGVKINRIQYWCDEFRDPENNRKQVSVKYDPWDMGIAYVYVNNKWRKCISEHYSTLQGRSEKEVQIAADEIKKRKKDSAKRTSVSSSQIAGFLKATNVSENALKQRIADRESKQIHSQINYGIKADSDNDSFNEIEFIEENNIVENAGVIQLSDEDSNDSVKAVKKKYRTYERF